jgi:rhodanese-related sulfurtransferase/DNA-binding transcriptional ArsR family regulator
MNDADRDFKNELFEQLARIGKAVGNPHRLELIDLLAQGERRVDALARETQLSVANASLHLQALQRARLVERRRVGAEVRYRLADPLVIGLWQAIRALGEARLAEVTQLVQQYFADRSQFEAVDTNTLRQRMAEDSVIVIDVRPENEYRNGHVSGARSIPVSELLSRLHELPNDVPIVAYCRGPYCVFADEAVALLTEHGYQAARLSDGFPDWQAAGFPVDTEQAGEGGRT